MTFDERPRPVARLGLPRRPRLEGVFGAHRKIDQSPHHLAEGVGPLLAPAPLQLVPRRAHECREHGARSGVPRAVKADHAVQVQRPARQLLVRQADDHHGGEAVEVDAERAGLVEQDEVAWVQHTVAPVDHIGAAAGVLELQQKRIVLRVANLRPGGALDRGAAGAWRDDVAAAQGIAAHVGSEGIAVVGVDRHRSQVLDRKVIPERQAFGARNRRCGVLLQHLCPSASPKAVGDDRRHPSDRVFHLQLNPWRQPAPEVVRSS